MQPLTRSPGDSARHATVRALAAELRQRGVFCAGDVLEEHPDTGGSAAGGMGWLLRRISNTGGGLSEWLSEGEGTNAATLVFAVLRVLRRAGEPVVLVEGAQPLFPPAVASLGIERNDMVLVRPESDRERCWAIEQALRCRNLGGVVAWVDRAPERFLRRLQLAVENGGGKGFLIRPADVRREKCWGDVRFLVRPRPSERNDQEGGRRRVEIEVLAGRGGIAIAGQTAVADICDATGAVRLVSPLADPTSVRRTAGA